MKVTIYTINDCKFSQAEKDYLKTNNIPFEEKNVEQNRDFLTEMLSISENFAGTPVTKIEKDDGTSLVLKGFTMQEFDKELGLATSLGENTAEPTTAPASPAVGDNTDMLPPTPPVPPTQPVIPTTVPDAPSGSSPATPTPPTPSESPIMPADSAMPAPQKADTQIEPISLSENLNTPQVPATSPTPPTVDTPAENTQIPVAPVASQPAGQPSSADTPASPAVPNQTQATDQLNSVLENLQNQVKTVAPEENQQPPKA